MGLEQLSPIIDRLPAVKAPLVQPTLNQRLFYTAAVLVLFFAMYHIYPAGVIVGDDTQTQFLQMVMASKMGSLITTGIGPIVLASIFLQLFVGAKIINLDLSNPKNKALFQGAQKLLAIILALFEAYIYTNLMQIDPIFGDTGTRVLVALQIALGSILLLYFDEIIAKYGIGSGIGLFIAGGVSLSMITGLVGILTGYGGIPQANTVIYHLTEGGANAIPAAIIALVPIIATILVFAISVYAENIKVEIPLAFERARGYGGRFPIKFLYTSNMPVILAFAFISAIQLFGRMVAGLTFDLGGVKFSDIIAVYDPTGRLIGGFFYLISPSFPSPIALAGGVPVFINLMLTSSNTWMVPFMGAVLVPEYMHAIIYVLALVVMSVIFGMLWTETSGMTSRDVAGQLKGVGLSVPGFRRDPRMIEGILAKYIPVITILGSGFVGLLAGMADLTGALGTGTGILLTAGILHKTYEEMESRQMFEMYPALKGMLGEE